jgi:hypothetical protein
MVAILGVMSAEARSVGLGEPHGDGGREALAACRVAGSSWAELRPLGAPLAHGLAALLAVHRNTPSWPVR